MRGFQKEMHSNLHYKEAKMFNCHAILRFKLKH